MRLIIVAASFPHADHDQPETSAVDVVQHELVRELRQLGHEIALQVIFNVHRMDPRPSAVELADIAALEREGISVFEPLAVRDAMRPAGSLSGVRRAFETVLGRPRPSHAYPAVRFRRIVRSRVAEWHGDAALTIWSPEGVAALSGKGHLPIVAYHGDVDHVPGAMRHRDQALFSRGTTRESGLRWAWRNARERLWLREFRLAHLALMREVNVIANVTAENAAFYERAGHPRSIYARNVWRPTAGSTAVESGPGVRIVGHAGRLDATGSTYGLRYLLREVLPELERSLAGHDFRVEIIGGGQPAPGIAPLLSHPRVVARGFVPDFDESLRSADTYLLLNNAGPFVAAFTRHLVAWSVGACLVVHERSRLAIPEIVAGRNALAGSSPREIADQVRSAVVDRALRARVIAEGHRTFDTYFTPAKVGATLDRELRSTVITT